MRYIFKSHYKEPTLDRNTQSGEHTKHEGTGALQHDPHRGQSGSRQAAREECTAARYRGLAQGVNGYKGQKGMLLQDTARVVYTAERRGVG